MPDFPIVDPHVHLWDPRRFRMRWVDGNAVLDRPHEVGEYREHTRGDWPVLLQASSYTRWVEALDEITRGLSDPARRKLWAENARRIYRL